MMNEPKPNGSRHIQALKGPRLITGTPGSVLKAIFISKNMGGWHYVSFDSKWIEFAKKQGNGYLSSRFKPSDFADGNFEDMIKRGLSR